MPGAERGHRWRVCKTAWLQDCWSWRSWSPTSVKEVRCSYWTPTEWVFFKRKCKLSAIVWAELMRLSGSAAEEVDSIWLPAENERKTWIGVFSRRVQHRDRRGRRADGYERTTCKRAPEFTAVEWNKCPNCWFCECLDEIIEIRGLPYCY